MTALRRREWECLERRAAGTAPAHELRDVRIELAGALAAAGDRLAAARLAALVLEEDAPAEAEVRRALLELACACGAAAELDAREASFAALGLLEQPERLELAERWIARGELAPADRVLAGFRAGAPDPSGAAAALRARLALGRGRDVAAEALLARVAESPARASERGARALLAGAESAFARRAPSAATFARAIEPGALRSPDELARLAVLRAALARVRDDLAGAERELAVDFGAAASPLRARAALEAARLALARSALAEAEEHIARAAVHLAAAAEGNAELWAVRGTLALARRERAAARRAFERAMERGRWSGADAAGEALEGFAALLAMERETEANAHDAELLGLPYPAPPGVAIEVVLEGPRRAFLATARADRLALRELDAGERGHFRSGARVLELELGAEGESSARGEVPFVHVLDAKSLGALLEKRSDVAAEGRDFLGFGGALRGVEGRAPIVEEELLAVAQCFPSSEQRLHLGLEATLERLRAAVGRADAVGTEQRYRVLHLVAEAARGTGAMRLAAIDAEERPVELDLAQLTEAGAPILPRADLVVLSLYANGADADLEPEQLTPWVRALLEQGTRAVLIGARSIARDGAARRELGHFYAALAEGESAARAWARARSRARSEAPASELAEAAGEAGEPEPIFTLYGDGALRARGWSPPNLAILAPEAVRKPWWIYFVTALVLPAVVFLLFRRLSTGNFRPRAR